ncbi:Wzz/FepE/Etk N-terminal domain-containing protein [Ligilactobacillus saerimneri]|uniref:Wzz/FepE/Etk N-terminal domain-containing protein n=1 Tax=Ligilactobacillus saerimneri TaxID=228229 RepID=UPI0030CFF4E8
MDTAKTQIDYARLWRVFKRYWVMIVGITVVFGGISFYKAQKDSNQSHYTAKTQVLVSQTKTASQKENEADSTVPMGTYRDLASNEKVVKNVEKILKKKHIDITAEELRKVTTVEFQDQSQVFSISVQTVDKRRSQLIAKYTAQEFQKEFKNIVNGYDVKVLNDVPQVERESSDRKDLKIIVVATVAGFILSSGVALLLDLKDKKIYSDKDIRSIGLSTLGQFSSKVAMNDDFTDYQMICANIDLVKNGKSLLVTTLNEEENSLAFELAKMWASKEKKVLFVDGSSTRGHYEDDAIQETEVSNLWMTSLQKYSNDKLDIADKKNMLTSLEKRFDWIVIDAPSFQHNAEVREWSVSVDGVVLIIKKNSTQIDELMDSIEVLNLGRAKILGYVMDKQ